MSEPSAEKEPTCKHCGLPVARVSGEGSPYYVHAEGPQRHKMTCALDPYGFNAEPVGADCERICNGSRGIEPERLSSPVERGDA